MDRKTTHIKSLGDAGAGVAVFATLGVLDRDGDVTMPGAFGEQTVKILPAHDWSHVPLGKARIYENGNEAIAEFQLNLDIEAARDWHAALKFDMAAGTPVQEWSYGFEITKSSLGQHDGKSARFLESLKVFEVSPVVLGAGMGTRTLAVKGGGLQLGTQISEACEALADLVARVHDLKQLRESEGRQISAERRAELAQLKAAIDGLRPFSAELAALISSDPAADDEARRLYSAFILTRRA